MLSQKEISNIKKRISSIPNQKTLSFFETLGDPTRLRLVHLLNTHKELCVTDIARILNCSLSSVSQHMRILELAGLVRKHRMGQTICYELIKNHFLLQKVDSILKSNL